MPDFSGQCRDGGGNVPLVLYYNDRRRADYHEADDGISPAVVAKYGTGGQYADDPDGSGRH